MEHVRQELQDFARLWESLLSPALSDTPPMHIVECAVLSHYASSLMDRCEALIAGKEVPMKVFRKQVAAYISAAETILSPASLGEPLTKEECQAVEFYSKSIADHCGSLGDNSTEEAEPCP